MRTRPGHWYRQSAALPVRMGENGLEILLVTSLKNSHWILPKGIVEPGMRPDESAAKEAWEEAGVKGDISETVLGTYTSRKWGGVCRVDAYRLDVREVAEDWLESGKRKRKWFSISDAVKEIKSAEATAVVKKLGAEKLRVVLVRHAKSSWADKGMKDFDRPLSSRGKRDGPKMAQSFAGNEPTPDLLLTSPAKRAVKTAGMFGAALGLKQERVEKRPEIYEAEMTELLALLRDLPEEVRSVMLVGHNPGLSELAQTLLGGTPVEMPTSAVAVLELEGADWKGILPGCATLVSLDYPKKKGGSEG